MSARGNHDDAQTVKSEIFLKKKVRKEEFCRLIFFIYFISKEGDVTNRKPENIPPSPFQSNQSNYLSNQLKLGFSNLIIIITL